MKLSGKKETASISVSQSLLPLPQREAGVALLWGKEKKKRFPNILKHLTAQGCAPAGLCSTPKQAATLPTSRPAALRQAAGAPREAEGGGEEGGGEECIFYFGASGGLRYLTGLRKVFPTPPIRKGIFFLSLS